MARIRSKQYGKKHSIATKHLVLSGSIVILLVIVACLANVCPTMREKPHPLIAPTVNSSDPLRPQTLDELLALNPDQLEKVDIARINLLCAVGLRGSESLDVDRCIRTLDAWASNINWEIKRNHHRFREHPAEYDNSLAYYRMGIMGTVLVQDKQILYNPMLENEQRQDNIMARTVQQWDSFFGDSGDVFMHGLLAGKHYGTCASMPFIYAAIGRRLGYPVSIAARRHHLYARYEEGNGKHLNIEATENQGFSTPSDEEYRNNESLMTDEEIQGCGLFRPLNNQEVLGICLQIRASCLRSMKRYDDEKATLTQALRYVPNTPLMRRVIEKNLILSKNLDAEDRCNVLWNQLANSRFPAVGSKGEYFRNRKAQVQLLAGQSTNMAEIEQAMVDLIQELKAYESKMSDIPGQAVPTGMASEPPANQQKFIPLWQDANPVRVVSIPGEEVPTKYRQQIPAELLNRLQKLRTAQEMIAEMHVFGAEEYRLRNIQGKQATDQSRFKSMLPTAVGSPVKISLEDIPVQWRDRSIPPELQERLSTLNVITIPSVRRSQINNEINRYFNEQNLKKIQADSIKARRMSLETEPFIGPPTRIEIK